MKRSLVLLLAHLLGRLLNLTRLADHSQGKHVFGRLIDFGFQIGSHFKQVGALGRHAAQRRCWNGRRTESARQGTIVGFLGWRGRVGVIHGRLGRGRSGAFLRGGSCRAGRGGGSGGSGGGSGGRGDGSWRRLGEGRRKNESSRNG